MQLHLVDGSAYIHRMFHAMPALTRPSDGMAVGAIAGVADALLSIASRADRSGVATHLAVVFDAKRRTFRNDIYADYKANRSAMPSDLSVQFDHMRPLCEALGIAWIEAEGYEADDVIATYTRLVVEAGGSVVIHSSDKDLFQLIRPGVRCYCAVAKILRGYAECVAKMGVPPDMIVDYQALVGDAVDNVPGVPSIGAKTAAALLQVCGDLDTLIEAASDPAVTLPCKAGQRRSLIEHADLARISRELVTLKDDVPVSADLASFALRPINAATADAFFAEMEFVALREKLAGMMPVAA